MEHDQTQPIPTPATNPLPSAFDLFKPSLEGLKLNFATLFALYGVFVLIVIVALAGLVAARIGNGQPANSAGLALLIAAGIALLGYSVVMAPASTFVKLKSSRGEKASFGEALQIGKRYCLRYLLLGIATGFLVLGGLLLLVVPGVILIRRYFLVQYALIDQDLGVGESMRVSGQLTKGRSGAVWGVIGVQLLIEAPSFIPFVGGVASFLLYLTYYCAPAIRYQQLKALGGSSPTVKA